MKNTHLLSPLLALVLLMDTAPAACTVEPPNTPDGSDWAVGESVEPQGGLFNVSGVPSVPNRPWLASMPGPGLIPQIYGCLCWGYR